MQEPDVGQANADGQVEKRRHPTRLARLLWEHQQCGEPEQYREPKQNVERWVRGKQAELMLGEHPYPRDQNRGSQRN